MNQMLLTMLTISLIGTGCSNPETPKQEDAVVEKPEATVADSVQKNTKYIVFFGNSLTAGYGVNPEEAFPALIQNRLDSLGFAFTVVNSGVSGETTATGDNRVAWVVSQQPVDIFILELGANDGLRGIPVAETEKNLLSIIDKVRAAHPKAEIILAGMMVPPNMGSKYSKEFTAIYPRIAKEKKTRLIPFLLEHVGGEDSLNQADGIHPTPEGHKIVAENVWAILKEVVNK